MGDILVIRTSVLFVEPIRRICITSSSTVPLASLLERIYILIWWSDLRGKYLTLSLKDIMIGLLQRNDSLNYLIILGKLTIWECRKNNTSPIIILFLHKVEVKKQVEKIIAIRNKKLRDFQIRWELLI